MTLVPGDILPRLVLTGPRGEAVDLSAPPAAGRANLLVIAGDSTAGATALLRAIAERRSRMDAAGARALLVMAGGARPAPVLPGLGAPMIAAARPLAAPAPAELGERAAGAMRLTDPSGELRKSLGAAASETVLLTVAPNQHVIALVKAPSDPDGAVEAAVGEVERRAALRETGMPRTHPPVLSVPDVFDPADCARLIEVFHTRGQEYVEPGHAALGARTTDCKMRIPDLGRRDRVDHWVVERDTQDLISGRLNGRLFPEIKKAFSYDVTRHERYRIARYEGERGGERMGHRDNTEPVVAHRRFAVTINLNAEDYEGGELRFAEFSDQLYKPASGTAIVFSCSLLHEVVGMRSGTRFALLAFLFGEH